MPFTNALACQLGSMPFNNLGLPLGTAKSNVQHLLPLVERIQKRLIGCAQFLTSAGKLEMADSVLSSMPTCYMSSLMVYMSIIEQDDKYIIDCINRGSDLPTTAPPSAGVGARHGEKVESPRRRRLESRLRGSHTMELEVSRRASWSSPAVRSMERDAELSGRALHGAGGAELLLPSLRRHGVRRRPRTPCALLRWPSLHCGRPRR
jgi:hypothetical protein